MGKKGTRRGSLSFWHRARSKRLVARMRFWNIEKGITSFAGYKAGMTDVVIVDDSESPTKGQEVVRPVTLVEVPPLFVYGVNALKKTIEGLKQVTQATALNAPKQAKRAITIAKNTNGLDTLQAKEFDELRLLALTQPWKIELKKTPELIEIPLAGTIEEQLEIAKKFFGKEMSVEDVFKQGEFIDVTAVSKGKGWQGVVKRYGVALNPRKATAHRRKGGTLGGETQARIFFSVPRPGQTGFHRRTDFNKRILKISSDSLPAFKRYGEVKGTYLMLDGSIPGPAKRLVRFRHAIDTNRIAKAVNILSIQAS